jgi:homopolymeric O-antigen transport system permease protein
LTKIRPITLVLRPRVGWRSIDLGEMWQFRELLFFLIWRDIKIRYRQTAMGIAWAVLQPLATMLVFTLMFNRVSGIESGSGAPYPLFAYAGLLVWTFFASAVAQSSNSLLASQQLITKIYFPRPFIPIGSTGALVLDLFLGLILLFALFAWYDWPLSLQIIELPLFIVGAFLAASGVGLILSSLSVRFRDFKYVVPFLVQMGLFLTPVIYPPNLLDGFPLLGRVLMLNPMAGMVGGFRHCLLGDAADWPLISTSFVISIALFIGGLVFFRAWERHFADII